MAVDIGAIRKQIEVVLKWKTHGEKDAKAFEKKAKEIGLTTKELTKQLNAEEKALRKKLLRARLTNQAEGKNLNQDKERLSIGQKLIQQRGKVVSSFLALLFAGQALQRAMGGLLQTSMDWVGINEIISFTLGDLFLPIILALLDPLLMLMDFFMGLSDNTKFAIGAFVLFLFVLGVATAFVGQLVLSVLGVVIAFNVLGGSIPAVTKALSLLGFAAKGTAGKAGVMALVGSLGKFLLIGALVGVAIYLLYQFFDELKEIFPGLADVIPTASEAFKGLLDFMLDLTTIGGNAMRLFAIMIGLFVDGVKMMFFGLVWSVSKLIESRVNFWLGVYDRVMKLLGKGGTDFRIDGASDIWEGKMAETAFGSKQLIIRGSEISKGTMSAINEDRWGESSLTPSANAMDEIFASAAQTAGTGGTDVTEIMNVFNGYTDEQLVRKLDQLMALRNDKVDVKAT